MIKNGVHPKRFSITFTKIRVKDCFTSHSKFQTRLEPIKDQCSPSYKNQSIDLYCKSFDWFLYDGEHLVVNGLR